MTLVEKALDFASKKHDGQMDKNGTPHIMHTVGVASIIAAVSTDENLVAAAFLHDTLEDTETTYEELVTEFNEDIASLVKEVTKVSIEGRKMFPNLHSQRGFTLKFADMTHNASRMGDQPFEWQQRWINKIKYWMQKVDLTK